MKSQRDANARVRRMLTCWGRWALLRENIELRTHGHLPGIPPRLRPCHGKCRQRAVSPHGPPHLPAPGAPPRPPGRRRRVHLRPPLPGHPPRPGGADTCVDVIMRVSMHANMAIVAALVHFQFFSQPFHRFPQLLVCSLRLTPTRESRHQRSQGQASSTLMGA